MSPPSSTRRRGAVLVAVAPAQDLEDVQEQVEDVEVQPHGRPHVLVHGVALDEVERVVDDV